MESGTMLAHYRVEKLVGKGGMGEVYRARDTKLDRVVALKILPREFAVDGDRLARFEREARVLASLNHPNIASIFGFESLDEATFLVMEFVEGDDLAVELRGGPLSIEDAVEVARQIAEGLEEAHENGIVHRDLKPANVKRTPEGKVKILDFGLARAFAGQSAVEEAISSAPTMTAAMTQAGTVLGTAAYMSPEQARGKEVDRRADIWAFGLILFEMLTGKQTFVGETASDTLAGILKSEPEWDALPDGLPYQVERVLRRCLAKDPRQRLRDIGEARVRLEHPDDVSGLISGPMSFTAEPAGRKTGMRGVLPWGLLALSLAVIAWLAFFAGRGDSPGALYLAVPAPRDANFYISGSYPGLPEISPDGRKLAFSASGVEDRAVNLYVRSIDAEEAVELSDTRNAQYPFWSPDSRWLAYYVRDEGLMKIPVGGGPPQLVCKAGNGKGGSWNQFGDILLTTDFNTSILRVPASGGEAEPVTRLTSDTGFNSHRHPQFLPDGRHFLYFARGGGKVESQIRFASLDDTLTTVVMGVNSMAYYASGHLVYVSHGDLVAQPFDPQTGTLSGSPAPLVVDVMTVPGAAKGAFSVSTEGSLAYLRGESAEDSALKWRDRTGRDIEQVGDLAPYDFVELSPDERTAAVTVIAGQVGTWDIWLFDLERNFRTRFTTDPVDDYDVRWSRDSRALYFLSDRNAKVGVYRKEVGSPAAPELVLDRGATLRLWGVSDDEQTLFCSEMSDSTGYDLVAESLAEGVPPRLLTESNGDDAACRFSPDGKWLAFYSDESGTGQVYLAPWPAMEPVTQVSTSSGTWFAWGKNGQEIVYQEQSGRLLSVSIAQEGGRLRIGEPQFLFQLGDPSFEGTTWSMTADGERFLVVDKQDAIVPQYCSLVMNWPAMLAE